MSMEPKTKNLWKARFIVHPNGIAVSKVLNLPDVTLVTESIGGSTRVTSVEITTPILSLVDAKRYSQRMANRCADILSFISGYGVTCYLKQMNEIGGEVGTAKAGTISVSFDASLERPEEVDLTKPAFLRVIQEKDEKLARQLSHFRRGISSLDIIEQIREFYQIVEDEYGESHPKTAKYRYVRHIVSHPELVTTNAKAAAIQMMGKSYLDPSEPNDVSVLSNHLVDLKKDALNIIRSKTQKP